MSSNIFPAVSHQGQDGALSIEHGRLRHDSWDEPIGFENVSSMQVDENQVLSIFLNNGKHKLRKLKLKRFEDSSEAVLQTVANYYGRYSSASEYQQHKSQAETNTP